MGEIRVCAVCGRVLDRWEPDDGGAAQYVHTYQDRKHEDHPAVPATLDEIPGIGRCDFCNNDYPTWVVPVNSFPMPGLPGHNSDGDWAACETCKTLIVKSRWDTLARRAVDHSSDLRVPKVIIRAQLDTMYNRLRRNIKGEPFPIKQYEV
jgi:hypothetical protein